MLVAGGLVLIPTILTGRLIEERQRHIGELRRREHQLNRLSRRLGLALDTSKIGVWEMNITSNALVWDDRMNELYGYPADNTTRDYSSWASRLHPAIWSGQEDFRVAIETRGRYLSEYSFSCRVDRSGTFARSEWSTRTPMRRRASSASIGTSAPT